MEVDLKISKFKSEYHGKTYYFCSKEDKEMFDKMPRGYVGEHPEKNE